MTLTPPPRAWSGYFDVLTASHSAMLPPVIITVVCGTILTPILLKLSFRGHQESELVQNNIADRMAKHRQLDIITQQLLQQDEQLMKKH